MELRPDTRQIELPPTITCEGARTLRRDLRSAIADERCTAIILVGSERTFCEGIDFSALTGSKIRGAVRDFAACLETLRGAPKASLALVDGRALGGGVGLAAACDAVVATERSTFALPEVLFGLLPAVISPYVIERMSPRRFELWAMTGETRRPAEALRDGMIDEVVKSAALAAAARRWLKKLTRPKAHAIRGLRNLTPGARDRRTRLKIAVSETIRRLEDRAVRDSLQRYVETGIPPWEER